jgi:hypothetical protein
MTEDRFVGGILLGGAKKMAKIDLFNSPSTKVADTETITANVVNRSRKDVTNGAVVFDNASASCTVTFGAIRSGGGQASGSCSLNGLALTAKAAFAAADGSKWVGIAGDGTEFNVIDINLNDDK